MTDSFPSTETEHRARYRGFLQAAIPAGEWGLLREAAQRGQLTGSSRFAEEVAAVIRQRV